MLQGIPKVDGDPDLISWGGHANLTFQEIVGKIFDTSDLDSVKFSRIILIL